MICRCVTHRLCPIVISIGFILTGCSPTRQTAIQPQAPTGGVPMSETMAASEVAPAPLAPTPTVAPAEVRSDGDWATYVDDRFGFQFEYPAVYEEHDDCRPRAEGDPSGEYDLLLTIGSRIVLGYQAQAISSVDQEISVMTQGAQDVEIVPTPIAGTEGRFVSFRFGGTGRLGLAYLVERNGAQAILSLTPPWRCDFADRGITEGGAFEHLANTFRFNGDG